jgi:FKBP-type peptidyl-prolyl cis-trans isomerase 2
VPLEEFPRQVTPGQTLQAQSDTQLIPVIVKEVNETHAIIDANHPLSGKI